MEKFEKTFDNAAADYDQSRPAYVKGIYRDIFDYQPIGQDSRVLEIGLGTGKAAGPILETGCRFVGLEPGENLGALARERFRGYGNFSLCSQTFQDYVCPAGSFDLIYAATAFHWIPEEYGYPKVYDFLKPGGIFARFAYHAGVDRGRGVLTEEIQGLYREYMGRESRPTQFGEEDAKQLAEKALAYGFTDVKYALYHDTKDFTAQEYMSLLRTYSDHMKLEPAARKGLFDGIFHAIQRHGGLITVYYTMDLELARK